MGRIVGIDLGTTNSVVAVLEGGRPQVIASAEGTRTTASVVGFNREQELLVGQLARRQLVLNPRNTFANLKRFVGRKWEELEDSSLSVPYTVRANDQGNVRVVCPATEREYAPEELVASILRKLSTVQQIYDKVSDNQANRRIEFLEWIIIVLIAFEVVMSFVR